MLLILRGHSRSKQVIEHNIFIRIERTQPDKMNPSLYCRMLGHNWLFWQPRLWEKWPVLFVFYEFFNNIIT
jgi:hypothetical protein